MERGKSREILKVVVLLTVLRQGASETDRNFTMCGTWEHGEGHQNIWFDVKKGCQKITIAVNVSTLSIQGTIMGSCQNSSAIPLPHTPTKGGTTEFCVLWDALLDLLQLEVGGQTHTLCGPMGLQESCCTDLTRTDNNAATENYGIWNGSIRGDIMTVHRQKDYTFTGSEDNCKADICKEASKQFKEVNNIEKAVMKSGMMGKDDLPCAKVSVMELKKDFQGLNLTFPASKGRPPNMTPSVQLPSCVVPAGKKAAKVVLTYFSEPTLFQEKGGAGQQKERVLEVVGISVENEIISGLSESVRITFRHNMLPENETTECFFWDTRKDPAEVKWEKDGCETIRNSLKETECRCDHLTYFAILVQLKPRATVPHLKALTFITAVGCAVSLVSCTVLIAALTRLPRKKEQVQSSSIHRSLAAALLLLTLLFLLTGVLANVGNDALCCATGAMLHYALLCSFTWMGIEIFNAFWLIYRVLRPPPKQYALNLMGFGFPAVLVILVLCTSDVYGLREVVASGNVTSPYKMCWIKEGSKGSQLNYTTNISFLVCLVFAGVAMLYLVLRKVQNRTEWKQSRVAFLSLWGLCFLFGCTWGVALLDMGPLSEVVLFLFCILNSLQGFFLMLRFFILERVKRQGSVMDRSSSGSTRQHMLQEAEKS